MLCVLAIPMPAAGTILSTLIHDIIVTLDRLEHCRPNARRAQHSVTVVRLQAVLQTLMPNKLVIARTKGNAPPEDVLALRDAAVGLDDKRAVITLAVAGRISVWKGLSTDDTFKWHDALLSAVSECAPSLCLHAAAISSRSGRSSVSHDCLASPCAVQCGIRD
ncbi:MAG: hypothetical protein HC869_14730 [Rhodospirillales bacterium]|nr:hypothetical protein [Rhodospirillales bacterium]